MLALASVAGLYLVRGSEAFQAAPVSAAHSTFGANCSACHDGRWQTARRLLTFGDAQHSVSDSACQTCHQAARHVTAQLVEGACVSCHQEHRSERSLTQLADNTCTRCHRDLNEHLTEASFLTTISQFAAGTGGHPEFAILRSSRDGIGPRHEVNQVAVFILSDEGRGGGHWVDRGGLKFNHQLHLDATRTLDADRHPVQLECADCHLPDAVGARMRPIEYEAHCKKCHPLRINLLAGDIGDIPHASVEQVRGVIRERLTRRFEQSAEKATASTPLPLLPKPARLTVDQKQEFETQMELADRAVFGPEAKGACVHCHHVELRGGMWHVPTENPAVANTPAASPRRAQMVPSRWLTHGEFDHAAHRAVACADCHNVADSSETTDILLPPIAACRECHGRSESTAGTSRVRDDCVLCHTYHGEGEPFHGVPLDRLISGTTLEPPSPSTP